MNYRIHNTAYGTTVVYVFHDDTLVGMTNEENNGFITWIAEGNTPEEWQPDAT